MMRPRGCDYCHQTSSNDDGDTLHVIALPRKVNGDKVEAELCSTCLAWITAFMLTSKQFTDWGHTDALDLIEEDRADG